MLTALVSIVELLLYCGFVVGAIFLGFIILLFAFSLPFFISALVISGIVTLFENIREWYLGYKFRKELKYKDEHNIEDK